MTKEIPLTKGKIAIVDDDDYEWLSEIKWRLWSRGNTSYARAKPNLAMHREIAKHHQDIFPSIDNMSIDHINGNGLDNRKSNLRVCTDAENHYNSHKRQNGIQRYKGVIYAKNRHKFVAQINKDRIHYRIGQFDNDTDAAKAYDRAAILLFGKFACTNFNVADYANDEIVSALPSRHVKTSGFIGVSRFVDGNFSRWRASICVSGKSIHLGLYRNELEAAKIYDKAARENFGEYAKTNF